MTTFQPIFNEHDWEPLVEILRAELQEYGGLFNLLGQQQDRIIERRTDDVLSINNDIEAQTAAVQHIRQRREEFVADLVERAGVTGSGSFRVLIPFFPEVIRPLLEALVKDINHMVRRNRQKARQNHLLLSRAVELTEQMLRVLQPENFTRTYGRSGKSALPMRPPAVSRYHAVG